MARNLELEALIAKAPDDVGNYNVYADWLIQQGDPRGELINAQLKHETAAAAADRAALEERLGELHDKHDVEWLGELAAQKQGFSVVWRRGFLDSVTLGDDDSADIDFKDLYAKLRPLPVAQLFRSITFGAFQDDDQPTWDGGVTAMVEHGVPATLRKVVFDRGGYWDISGTYLNTLEPLYALAPQLEHLEIILGNMELGTIDLPNLKHFEVWTGGFTSDNMKAVVAANWPKLETLLLRFGGSEDYGANTSVDDVLPLLSSTTIPNVRHLALANSPFLDELIPHLAKSPLLKQLTTLDLSLGEMTDAGANAIVEHGAAFKHLENLNVHRNYLTEDAVAALKGVVASVDGGGQEDPEEDYRYCQIGE